MRILTRLWYSKNPWIFVLLPLSYIYLSAFKIHKLLYALNIKKIFKSPVPVIGIGNITVGGTGKTPFTIELAKLLLHAGYKPGIISRGYKGRAKEFPKPVTAKSDPDLVGDEPVLIAQRTNCPVVVAPKRSEAVMMLLRDYECDVILADDGLQHHALNKDMEIILIDAKRQYGNGFCLPAGPLREPISRLSSATFLVASGSSAKQDDTRSSVASGSSAKQDDTRSSVANGSSAKQGYTTFLKLDKIYNLKNHHLNFTPSYYQNKTIHAISGIGHPEQFFESLRNLGLNIIEHSFPDHHRFQKKEFMFCKNDDIVIMTEKDAVKCHHFATDNYWVLSVNAVISEPFIRDFMVKIKELIKK
jgi:tetraacyldisaccharide 4'-kinase